MSGCSTQENLSKIGTLHFKINLAVGSGRFDWSKYNQWCKNSKIEPSVLIEVRGFDDLTKSADFMIKNHLYPFD